jgi:cytosine/adenosine deaminase-related metal-dependent hydrolase
VLMPGFVNTHAHLARHLARGPGLRGPEAWRRYDARSRPRTCAGGRSPRWSRACATA